VFEKRDVRALANLKRDEAWTRAWDWWSRQGFRLEQTGPYQFRGASFYGRIGLRREVRLLLEESAGTTRVDLAFSASLTDEGLVGGAVAAVLFLPVAVVGGAISYTEYEADAQNLMNAFWQSIGAAPGSGVPVTVPPPCSRCGAALLPDWKVCPYCGTSRPPSP